MEKYESKQQQILLSAEDVFRVISRFDNLTPALADKVEAWEATADRCSFKAKGFTVKLKMDEVVENKQVKIVGDDGGVPMDFTFWVQLQSVSERDTRMRLVLHVELNMMMKMMVGSKLGDGLNQMAEALAMGLNRAGGM
ncbi:MAG: SRPBCC domain-containing protein [Rikenellaceae bacterium]